MSDGVGGSLQRSKLLGGGGRDFAENALPMPAGVFAVGKQAKRVKKNPADREFG